MPDLPNESNPPPRGAVPLTKAERIRKDILKLLAGGQYPPGTRLPRERQLTVEFGASSTCVQDALRPLKVDGTLYTVTGQGTYVADPKNPQPTGNGCRRAHVEQTVRQRLKDGTYQPLTWLPSLRDLASEFRVSLATVQAALKPLKGENLLGIARGRTYVIDPENPAALPEVAPRSPRTEASR